MSPTGLCSEYLVPGWWGCLGRLEVLGGRALLEEECPWRWALRAHGLTPLQFTQLASSMWLRGHLLLLSLPPCRPHHYGTPLSLDPQAKMNSSIALVTVFYHRNSK